MPALSLASDPLVIVGGSLLVFFLLGRLAMPTRPKQGGGPSKQEDAADPVRINRRLRQARDPRSALALAALHAESADLVNLVTALYRAASLAKDRFDWDDVTLLKVLAQVGAKMKVEAAESRLTARAMSNLTLALAQLYEKAQRDARKVVELESLVDVAAEVFCAHAGALFSDLKELGSTVVSLTKLRRATPAVAAAALRGLDAQSAPADPEELVYFAWSFGHVLKATSVRKDAVVEAALPSLASQMRDADVTRMSSKFLGMASWAAVRLGPENGATCMPTIAREAHRRGLETLSRRDATSILWALGKCGCADVEFCAAFRTFSVAAGFSGFSGQDLANIVCAFVNLQLDDDEFLRLLARRLDSEETLTAVEQKMVRWAYGQRPRLVQPRMRRGGP